MPASDLQFLSDHGVAFLWQVLAAITAGGLLGYERQRMSKPVGMLTATLVTLGSTVIVLAGSLLVGEGSGAEDPTRLPSMIVSGIGFIGAGAIIRSKFKVSALASAATIWVLGALGILIGSGHALIAVILTVTIFVLIRFVPKLEHVQFRQRSCLHATVAVEGGHASEFLEFLAENQIAMGNARTRSDGEHIVLSINECGVEHRGELLHALRQFDGVVEVAEATRR